MRQMGEDRTSGKTPQNMAGRKTKLTLERQEKILTYVRAGMTNKRQRRSLHNPGNTF